MDEGVPLPEVLAGARALITSTDPRLAGSFEVDSVADGTPSLVLRSPSGERQLDIAFWADEGGVLSLEFGTWHTHADMFSNPDDPDGKVGLRDLAVAISRGQVVALYEFHGDEQRALGIVDLRKGDAVLDELTSPYGTGRIRIRSWDGTLDEIHDARNPR
jgi:hypothetical protein